MMEIAKGSQFRVQEGYRSSGRTRYITLEAIGTHFEENRHYIRQTDSIVHMKLAYIFLVRIQFCD